VIDAALKIGAEKTIVGGGDIFDTSDVSLEVADDIVDVFESHDFRLATIFGNHDLEASLSTATRVVLGHLMRRSKGTFQALPLLTDRLGYELAGCRIWGHHYKYDNHLDRLEVPVTGDQPRVIISHSMILKEAPIFENYTLFSDVDTNADLILLGHYHPMQEMTKLKNARETLIGGPGALMRGALSRDDITRTPSMAVVERVGSELMVDFVPIACARPADEIFKIEEAQAESRKNEALAGFVADLDNLKVQGLNVAELIESLTKSEQIPDDVKEEALRRIGII
jgi:DNA repair exonuclease SbcCD nuclease subunit